MRWPILSREDRHELHPEAAGAAARRGAVADAGSAPDADATVPGSAVAPRAGLQEPQEARSAGGRPSGALWPRRCSRAAVVALAWPAWPPAMPSPMVPAMPD